MMKKSGILMFLGVLVMLLSVIYQCGAEGIRNTKVAIRAVKTGNAFTGFDVIAENKTAASVRLSSNSLITADNCMISKDGKSLAFNGLRPKINIGLQLGKNDYIKVSLDADEPYPSVSFNINIIAFNPDKWQSAVGKHPFHFLAMYMSDAEVWHQRGWLNATPVSDPYPLLLDTHVGTPEISGYKYNRNWSYTPPLGAHPLPVIGLWAPESNHYAGFEFQTARLQDNTEKDIATGYCWGFGKPQVLKPNPGQFISLVYPYGGPGYQSLVFPKPGSKLASKATLIWSLNLPSTSDPNELLVSYIWKKMGNWLPNVPEVVDLSWIPGGIRLDGFQGYPNPGHLIGGAEKPFAAEGTKSISGWGWHNESPTMAPAKLNDQDAIRAAKETAQTILPYMKRFKVRGEECVFWDKPYIGQWTPDWGGKEVETLHNSNGFSAGRLFLGLYRDLGMTEYLPVVDGIFNWAKNIVWTRNEFADVPSSPFAIGGTLTASFCLDYYMTFKDSSDEHLRNQAQRALELARSFTYRYMILWLSDNNKADNMDSSFLWEPNSGRDWTGAACSNEVFWNIDTLAQVAVHTGDPVLMWALQGTLDRWFLMYQDKYRESLAQYQASDMTEGYGLYEGNIYGVGVRAQYGFASPLYMTEPVGSSVVRVLAGEKAAMPFNKDGTHTTISDYRYSGVGNLSFTVHSTRSGFDLSLTVPYVDISGKPVAIVRDGKTEVLSPGTGFTRQDNALWSLIVKNLNDGDKVIIGTPDVNGEVLPSSVPLTRNNQKLNYGQFTNINLPYDTRLDQDWDNLDSWVGLPNGSLWAYGIPFTLASPDKQNAVAKNITFQAPVNGADGIAVLYSKDKGPAPSLIFTDGSRSSLDDAVSCLAWRAWPAIYTNKLIVSAENISGRKVAGIDPGNRKILSVTAIKSGFPAIMADLKKGMVELARIEKEDAVAEDLDKKAESIPAGLIAMLPPNPSGPAVNLVLKSKLAKKQVMLSQDQLIDSSYFNAKQFPVALYASREEYIYSVRTSGDAANALVQYVKDGGTLILVSSMPWPMFYATGFDSQGKQPLTYALGLPLLNVIEDLPKEKLKVYEVKGQNVLGDVPDSFDYPAGDPRLRIIESGKLAPGVKYTPIYKVIGESEKDYGDAGGLLEFPNGQGRILYLWGGLTRSIDGGMMIVKSALDYAIEQAKGK